MELSPDTTTHAHLIPPQLTFSSENREHMISTSLPAGSFQKPRITSAPLNPPQQRDGVRWVIASRNIDSHLVPLLNRFADEAGEDECVMTPHATPRRSRRSAVLQFSGWDTTQHAALHGLMCEVRVAAPERSSAFLGEETSQSKFGSDQEGAHR
ncbi:unnamed protein product [Pleuronectes platessa]|uniref:Uncharacterized protein n=1 Tax=Pleuronectes platessa TaxID=8262 RepID=A0A9N7TKH7_PLEPL|nr:unnamed protein product [Pleuronectes platessa]